MKAPRPVSPRLRDAGALLPAIGAFLLMPPVITLFAGAHVVAGVPLIVVYLFGVWLALIVCAALLARRLARFMRPPLPPLPPPAEAPASELPLSL